MTPQETPSQPDPAVPPGTVSQPPDLHSPTPDAFAGTQTGPEAFADARTGGDGTGPNATRSQVTPTPSAPHLARNRHEILTPPGYTLSRELGRGGMGVVYAATDDRLKRDVALKMLLRTGDERRLIRFLIEAEAMAQVRHPHVVQIFEAGETGAQPFLAMEYLPGDTLAAKLSQGRVPTRDALKLVLKIARGVEAAHRQGIVHRDLKPGNVMFDGAGEPKVTDFGLAKHGTMDLTATEATMGTPAYMAPEQAKGEAKTAGSSADVFSLGVMLYEMTTGARPFVGESTATIIYKVIHEAPEPPRRRDPSIPRDVEIITLKCLQKDPRSRYADAGQFADDLERFLANKPITARPVGRLERAAKWVRRNPAVTASLMVAVSALIAGSVVSYVKYREAKTQEGIAKEKETLAQRKATEAENAQQAEAERVKERDAALDDAKYQLGVGNCLLAGVALEKREVALARERLDLVPPEQRSWEWNYLARQCEGGLFTLTRHSKPVTSVAFSPDGLRMVTGSADQTAVVWDAKSGNPLVTLRGHSKVVTSVAFSPDGSRVITGSRDEFVKIWNARSGELLMTLPGYSGKVSGVAFSPDDSRILTGEEGGVARIWDAKSGKMLLVLNDRARRAVTGVAFHPDGIRVITGFSDKTAAVWDGKTGVVLQTITEQPEKFAVLALGSTKKGASVLKMEEEIVVRADDIAMIRADEESAHVNCVAFSPDGSRIVTGSQDNSALIWNAKTGAPLLMLRGHANRVISAAFSPDGLRVVTGSSDTTAKVWDVRTGEQLYELKGHLGVVAAVTFSPDGGRILTGSSDRTAKVWTGRAGGYLHDLKPDTSQNRGKVVGLAYDRNHSIILSCGASGELTTWDAKTGLPGLRETDRRSSPHDAEGILAGDYCSRTSRLVTCGGDGWMRFWDVRTYSQVSQINSGFATAVAFSPDGSRVTCYCYAGIAAWDVESGVRLWDDLALANEAVRMGVNTSINCMAFSPDGSRIIAGSTDRSAKILDARTGACLLVLKGHIRAVTDVAFSPDGSKVITSSNDRRAILWDAKSGKALVEFRGHTQPVTSVTFSPDGSRIVTGSEDRTAKVWDTKSGAPLVELRGHAGTINKVAFRPDGTQIATADHDGAIKIWDARQSPPPITLNGHADLVTVVGYSPDGSRVVTGSEDKTAKVWDANTGELLLDLKGHSRAVTYVGFKHDGSAVVTQCDRITKVWDAKSGTEITGKSILTSWFPPDFVSPDGRVSARINGATVELTPQFCDGNELEHRLSVTRPNEQLFKEALSSVGANERFAAAYYVERILFNPANRTGDWLEDRNRRSTNPAQIARSTFYHPALYDYPYDKPLVYGMAVANDRLSKRILAQEKLCNGEPKIAIPLLFEVMLSRPAGAPPVEELMLAKAYLDLNQTDEAKRFHQAATAWLDRPRNSMRGANMASHAVLNGWAVLGEAFKPIEDPRLNILNWESWHECDVFRSQIDHRLGFGPSGDKLVLPPKGRPVKPVWLTGHLGRVEAVAQNEEWIISTNTDTTVRFWNVRDHKQARILKEHGLVRSVAIKRQSAGDSHIYLGAHDGSVIVDGAAGFQKGGQRLGRHSGPVLAMSVSRDGKWLVTGGGDHLVQVWDLDSRKLFKILKGHREDVLGVAFDYAAKRVASVSSDGSLFVWDVNTGVGKSMATPRPQEDPSWSVAFSPDGQLVAIAREGNIQLWNSETLAPVRDLSGPVGSATGLSFAFGGRVLVNGCFDGTVRLWDVKTGIPVAVWHGHERRMTAISVSHDERKVVSADWGGYLAVWEIPEAIRQLYPPTADPGKDLPPSK